jgi:hypothetical protein
MPKKKDATQEGVSEEKEIKQRTMQAKLEMPGALDPKERAHAIEMLADNALEAEAKSAEEQGGKFDIDSLKKGDGEEAQEEKETEEEETEEESEEKEEVKDTKPEAKEEAAEEEKEEQIEIVVYGEKKLYPKSQVDAHGGKTAFQKELAADRKMEEASSVIKELKELKQELLKKPDQLPREQDQDADEDKELEALRDDLAKKRKARYDANQFEDEDAALKADEEYEEAQRKVWAAEAGRGGSSATPEKVKQTVTETLKEQEYAKINKQFYLPPDEGGFADLTFENDPLKFSVFQSVITHKINNEGKSDMDWKTYEETGNEVRKMFGEKPAETGEKPTKKKVKVKTDELDQKRKKKAEETDTVKGVNQKPDAPSEEQQPQTEEEARRNAVAEMREERAKRQKGGV